MNDTPTPRTDEEARCPRTNEMRGLVSVFFARELERELAASHAVAEQLAEALEELKNWYFKYVGLPAVRAIAAIAAYRANHPKP